MTLKRTLQLIKSDFRRRLVFEGRRPSAAGYLSLVISPPALAVMLWRLQSYFHSRNLYPLSKLVLLANISLFATEIDSQAQIGEGFVIGNTFGVLMHTRTRIGRNCTFMHYNGLTIGPRRGMDAEHDWVIVEDGVVFGPGARAIGNLTIGHHCRIEANSVVTRSAPPCSVLAGIPAEVIGKVSLPDEAAGSREIEETSSARQQEASQ